MAFSGLSSAGVSGKMLALPTSGKYPPPSVALRQFNPAKTNGFTRLTKLLTPEEVGDMLRFSLSTVYRLVAERQIPFRRISGSLRFDETEIVDFINRGTVKPMVDVMSMKYEHAKDT